MHVIVVGSGRVGVELIHRILESGHSVAVVDKNPASFLKLGEELEIDRIVGFGFDADTLRQAGIERAGALAAVTSGDNSNILIARVAHEQFDIERVVARIQEPARAEIYQRLGIATVASVVWSTDQIFRRIDPDAPRNDWLDPSGAVVLLERELPAAWAGRKLSELDSAGRFTVAAVSRLGGAEIVTPELVGQSGDILRIVASTDAIVELDAALAADHGGH